tara:strand:- start:501 stop:791 length:291 start_codon:yes stop_codon:yes gene_type:complete
MAFADMTTEFKTHIKKTEKTIAILEQDILNLREEYSRQTERENPSVNELRRITHAGMRTKELLGETKDHMKELEDAVTHWYALSDADVAELIKGKS